MIFNIIKTIHIISVISWMAGLLYLPRIFVYHADPSITKDTSSTFKIMEKKLFNYIMIPAAMLTWITGVSMIYYLGLKNWLTLKIIFVLALTVFHLYCGRWLNLFALDKNINSDKFFRIRNEFPTIIMILVIITVVFKPFS
jgi:putative membrane protein